MVGGHHCLFKPWDFLEMTSYQAQASVTAVNEFSMKVSEERERRLFLVRKSGNREESKRQSKKHESNVEED